MGENDDDEDENDEGNAVAPHAPVPTAVPVAHEVILADAEPEPL
jgi:hypothetical protein